MIISFSFNRHESCHFARYLEVPVLRNDTLTCLIAFTDNGVGVEASEIVLELAIDSDRFLRRHRNYCGISHDSTSTGNSIISIGN